jgi:hypothetical protein
MHKTDRAQLSHRTNLMRGRRGCPHETGPVMGRQRVRRPPVPSGSTMLLAASVGPFGTRLRSTGRSARVDGAGCVRREREVILRSEGGRAYDVQTGRRSDRLKRDGWAEDCSCRELHYEPEQGGRVAWDNPARHERTRAESMLDQRAAAVAAMLDADPFPWGYRPSGR